MRRKYINFNYLVGYSSISLLGLLLLALFLPHASSSSTASSCLDDPTMEGCYTTMAETEVGVTASTAISLAMSPQVNMEVIPKSNGATSSASTKLSVSTNSPDGYALYMQTGSVSGDLVSTASYSESKIANTTKSNVTLSNLEQNSYGYALAEGEISSSTTYSTVPTTGNVIKKTTSVTPSEGNYAYGDTYNLAFGVNVGTNLEAGTYTGSVMISAVANPKTIATMFDLTYMQDMTSDICVNTREGYTKQLIDTRDGKSYWVAKLKDGNCWMVQNLALDIPASGLKATDTDIVTDWNSSSVHPPKATEQNESLYTANDYQRSWNLGKYILITPEVYAGCTTDDGNNSFALGMNLTQVCSGIGLIDVSDSDWKPTFTAQEKTIKYPNYVRKTVTIGDTTSAIYIPSDEAVTRNADRDENGNFIPYEYTGLVTADPENKTYDAHYLFGNYYQWSALVAGNIDIASGENAPGTICPKGWTLPIVQKGSDNFPVNLDSSFYHLMLSLNYQSGSIWIDTFGNPTLAYSRDGHRAQYVFGNPLYYIRNGHIGVNSEGAFANGLGSGGSMYSKTANTANSGNKLTLHSSYMGLAYIWATAEQGVTARCLAR